MTKTNIILLIVVVLLIVLSGGILAWKLLVVGPVYHAVYLTTGDIYFGTLIRFPTFGLKQAYTIQINPENEETPLSVQRFRNVFWGPEDFLRLNREQVVWTAKLDSAGQLAQLITANPDLLPGAQTQQQGIVPEILQ